MREALLFIAAAVLSNGAVVSRDWADGKLAFTLEDGSAEIEWISPVAFRYARFWKNAAPTALPAIKHDQIQVEFEDTRAALTMRGRYITIAVDKDTEDLHVTSSGETIVNLKANHPPDGASLHFAPVDKAFGLLGGARLNIRGETLQRDHGFFFTSNGYGMYFRAPQRCTFDFAQATVHADGSHALELVFYFGPTPKEIFEQHQAATGRTELTSQSLAVLASDRLPAQALLVAEEKIDSFNGFSQFVLKLNQWSLSAVLYPAFNLASIENPNNVLGKRCSELASILPIIYGSSSSAPFNQTTRDTWKPYLLTYLREAYDRGYPVIRPLPMQFSKDKNMEEATGVFMLGDEILVAPMIEPGTRRTVKLPRGRWTDLRANIEYPGNQHIEIDAPLGHLPMFARNGAVFPLARKDAMELHYFPSLGGEFFLWEQEKQDNSQFHAAPAGDFTRVEIESKVARTYEWVIHHATKPSDVAEESVRFRPVRRRSALAPGSWWYDAGRHNLHIMLRADADSDRIVNIAF